MDRGEALLPNSTDRLGMPQCGNRTPTANVNYIADLMEKNLDTTIATTAIARQRKCGTVDGPG